jgi:hypothetical protein
MYQGFMCYPSPSGFSKIALSVPRANCTTSDYGRPNSEGNWNTILIFILLWAINTPLAQPISRRHSAWHCSHHDYCTLILNRTPAGTCPVHAPSPRPCTMPPGPVKSPCHTTVPLFLGSCLKLCRPAHAPLFLSTDGCHGFGPPCFQYHPLTPCCSCNVPDTGDLSRL